jgi:cytidylate kinase
MASNNPRPKLITFDGEARSGKGTIVQALKDVLRDTYGYHVMLIDRGQAYRSLVVAAAKAGVDMDNPAEIDAFLGDEASAEASVKFVKDVYHMGKNERDSLLYTNEVGANSAKIGARPLSQYFTLDLTKKWLQDAREEGYDIVLMDGRALEEVGTILEKDGLCDFIMNLYFVCDPVVGARRTLSLATQPYDSLSSIKKADVDELVQQIRDRNDADRQREVQPIVPPVNASVFKLPDISGYQFDDRRFDAIIDTSAEITKEQMCKPVIELVAKALNG